MEKLTVVKIGGNVIDNPVDFEVFLTDFSAIDGCKILVHGGGKIASDLLAELGIESKLVQGRRITDVKSLKIVTMVYAGLINKSIVAKLQSYNCNAIGLSGADGNLIRALKRPIHIDPLSGGELDYGFVGDLYEGSVNSKALFELLNSGFIPVFSAITHDGNGQLLNTNADTVSSVISTSMVNYFDTSLIYCLEKPGVLSDFEDESSVIRQINMGKYQELTQSGQIRNGMIPKLVNAFDALNKGLKEVYIGKADALPLLKEQNFGTRLILE
ncbi:MAG: acetylglutamate kinase [Flavobacterium sp.]|nr:acetylglutamate kinase [Pedobacter sp.]